MSEQGEGFHHFLPPFMFETVLGGRYKVVEKQDELLLTEIESVLEAWQDEGKDYIVHHSFTSMAYEILAKAKQHYEQKISEQLYVEIKPKHCTECGEDYTPIIHSDECPHDKVGVSEQKRLDRSELREKIKNLIRIPYASFENYEQWLDDVTDQILALIPDIEEAKKQEGERIIKAMDEYCLREIDHAKTMKATLEGRNAENKYIYSEETIITTLARVRQALQSQLEEG